MPTKVAYERVNLADIETSSEEDDYGDLFAHERRMGHGKSRPLRNLSKKKGGKCMSGSLCWKSLCVVSVVFAILGLLAGVAIYMDPESSLMDLMPKVSTVSSSGDKQENTVATSLGTTGTALNGSNLTTAAINTSLDNAGVLQSLTTSEGSSESVVKNATTKSRGNHSEDNEALEQGSTKEKVEVMKEGDKSDEKAAKAETLETWSSSSFFSSASPQDLLRLVSGQSSSTSSTGY